MKGFASILALSLMLAGVHTATAKAAPVAATSDLTAAYQAIFAPAPQAAAEPVPEPAPETWCCTDTGSCVGTTADKCTNTYHGTQHATLRDCLHNCP